MLGIEIIMSFWNLTDSLPLQQYCEYNTPVKFQNDKTILSLHLASTFNVIWRQVLHGMNRGIEEKLLT